MRVSRRFSFALGALALGLLAAGFWSRDPAADLARELLRGGSSAAARVDGSDRGQRFRSASQSIVGSAARASVTTASEARPLRSPVAARTLLATKSEDGPASSQVRRSTSPSEASVEPSLLLARPQWQVRSLLVRVDGFDREAPRRLTLWRVDPESNESARLASAMSDAAGTVRFERIALPGEGARLVVAPSGVSPSAREASRPVDLSPRVPEPPRGRLLGGEASAGDRIEVQLGESTGWLLVADRAARERARLPLPAQRGDGSVAPTSWPAPKHDGVLLLAREDVNGRRSRWRAVFLEPAQGEKADGGNR